MRCARCRRELPDGSIFCNFCGKRQGAALPVHKRKRRRAKGSGTVYKLPGNRTRPWVAFNGVVVGTFASSAEAVEALDRFNANRAPAELKNCTLQNIYNLWSPNAFAKISPKSQTSYENAFERAKALHNRRIRDLKTEDYQQVIDGIVADGLSRSLCEKQRLLFSQLCQYAMKQDIINKNYAQLLELPPSGKAKTRVISDEELERIGLYTSDPKLGFVAKATIALCYTGMRINELLRMRREDVHLQQRYMIGGEKTDAGRDRMIPIHHEALPIIQEWMEGNDTEWLVHTAAGGVIDDSHFRRSFRALMAACGIKGVTPHTCRHTAATKMVSAGLRPEIVKQILGHTDFSLTVNRYTHTPVQELLDAVEQVC